MSNLPPPWYPLGCLDWSECVISIRVKLYRTNLFQVTCSSFSPRFQVHCPVRTLREQYNRGHDLKRASILVGNLQQNTSGSFGSACSYWSILASNACVIQKSHAIFITRHDGTTHFVRTLTYNISQSCDIFRVAFLVICLSYVAKLFYFRRRLKTSVLILHHVLDILCVVVLRTLLSIWDRFFFLCSICFKSFIGKLTYFFIKISEQK